MILIPIRTGRGQNDRGHWRTKHRRTKGQLGAVGLVLNTKPKPQIPCSVLLTRVAPSNGLDDDNLAGSLKAVRDAVAAWLGVDDRHRDQVRYRYAQKRGEWGVEISFGLPVVGAQHALEFGAGVCDPVQVGDSPVLAAKSSVRAPAKAVAGQRVADGMGDLSSSPSEVVNCPGLAA